MINMNGLLFEFLSESSDMSKKEFDSLTEGAKNETVRELALSLFESIKEKISYLDLFPVDRSKGDVKQLKDLNSLQTAVNQLETLMNKSSVQVPSECKEYLSLVVKSIIYLNKYSTEFKDAYRNKKTLLVLKYQSLILSVFSAVAYLISVMVDSRGNNLQLRGKIAVEKIAPIKTLEEFNQSIENGTFRNILKDVVIMRENFQEVSVEDIGSLVEGTEFLNVISGGLNTFIDKLNSSKLSSYLYKAAGVLLLLLSVREIFYMLTRLRTKVTDIFDHVRNFASVNFGSSLSKLQSFSNKFAIDAEEASKMARYDIEDENKDVSKTARMTPDTVSFDNDSVNVDNSGMDLGFM